MSKGIKRAVAVILCLILFSGTVAIGGEGLAEVLESLSVKAHAVYSVGDTIYYGTYPQSDVTSSLGSVLNSQSGTWKSYNYYSGTGTLNDGQMTASDYMRYKDVTYSGNKYRGVTFDSYRPYYTGSTSSALNTRQDENGYTTGTTYWFKFEPIKWRVLDPSTGLIMCETIIDSQPYNNYILYADSEYWGDSGKTYYAYNYAKSSIRQWLNNDFYNTAFSDEQKTNIITTSLNNDGYPTLTGTTGYEEYDAPSTSDKVFLLSYNEVSNSGYGFSKSTGQAKGSDYAKCQGLEVENSSGIYDGTSFWWLRSPSNNSIYVFIFATDGHAYGYYGVGNTNYGVRPALKLQNLKSEIDEAAAVKTLADAKAAAKKEVSAKVEDGCSQKVKDIRNKALENIEKAKSVDEVNQIKDKAVNDIVKARQADCPHCGLEHGGFFGWLIKFFHSILAMFGNKYTG